jgi:hypothetical protein
MRSTNFGDHVLFVWNRGRFTATMPLSSTTHVGILRSAPVHKVFSSFVTMGDSNPLPPNHFCCTVVTDDEADELESDEEDNATLSSTASIEGDDDADSDSNPASTLPNAPGDDVHPVVIPFDLDHDDPSINLASQDDATNCYNGITVLGTYLSQTFVSWQPKGKFLNDSPVVRILSANPVSTARLPRSRGRAKVKSTRSERLLNRGNASQSIT